ncbi:MAG: BACON domain-containing protein, partial [Alistipes sp.]|nr:BACON domain-containing protein [Alistipes sp.]
MKNTFFKSFMAIAAVVASFAFTACDDSENGTTFLDPDVELSVENLAFTQAEESKTFDLVSDADWKVDVPVSADWVTVTPQKGGAGQHTLTVSVAANNSGSAREAIIRVSSLHPTYGEWDTEKLTVSQSATEEEIKPLEVVYSENFDKKEAVKDGNYWPWLKDTAADYTNPQGSGAANVTYESANVTVRANSASDSNYSDYAGSGLNNLFFGARINYVTVSGIEL